VVTLGANVRLAGDSSILKVVGAKRGGVGHMADIGLQPKAENACLTLVTASLV
jgi:hypothetical protein